ncbi:MAG: tRNA 2-thiouridine(34) synthase MnmA [Armatimonadota bacterium]
MTDRAGMTVVVAMSGGVDSSVAAALLKERGYNVIGVTLQIWPSDAPSEGQGCCSLDAVEDARRVATMLDIPHYVLNMREEFERSVIADFLDEYSRGRTPNPCIRCNEHVKFSALLGKAQALGADRLATGHYARIGRDAEGRFTLLRAADPRKDQSYVLYMLGQRELARLEFPLGEMAKKDARTLAREMGLPVWRKPDSQEICFVGSAGHRAFLAQRRPETAVPGEIRDTSGRLLGRHSGAAGFTIGQRKGIGVAAVEPLYVVDIDTGRNIITVGRWEELMATSVRVGAVKWVSGEPPAGPIAVTCKVRYNMREVPATVRPLPDGEWELEFVTPERAPTPGQAAVFYDGETVLGGGTIESVCRGARQPVEGGVQQ